MKKIYDLIIVGGGPAGITAGIFAARQKLKTLLITKEFGGQMKRKALKVENFPGFKEISAQDLINKFVDHLKKYEVEIILDEVIKIEKKEDFSVLTKGKKEFFSKTVIVASGADPRPLLIPGEKEFLGKGVSYCALCDAPLFKEKKVAVVGGGNAGFETAIFLAEYAEKIYILEFSDKVKADEENQQRAKKTGKIEIILNAKAKEIRGENFVKSLIYEDKISKKEKEIFVDGVFIQVGQIPATFFVKNLVDLNEKNEIIVKPETLETKTPGLFAAGDCNFGKYKLIVVACAQGAIAALSAYAFLQQKKAKD